MKWQGRTGDERANPAGGADVGLGPASRFGSSGLLTTVSLFFAARVFRPNVDQLVFSDIWFLVVLPAA